MKFRPHSVIALCALLTGAKAGETLQAKEPNFAEDIAPLVFAKCTACHRDGQSAPFSLMNYAQVKKRARQIADITDERTMPPWHADKGVVEYANDRSLTDGQIALFRRWVEAGTPEGDGSKLPPTPTYPEGWTLGKPDLVATTSAPYAVPAEGPDVYRNFVVPLNLEEDTWVNALEFKPGAPSVVHHVLYFLDTKGVARGFDEADPEPGYNGMGRSNGNFRYLGGWDLGTQSTTLGYGLAWMIPKGADLIMQVHYHPNGKTAEKDQSSLAIYKADKPTARPWTIVPVPPFFGILSGIHVPAGEKEYIKESSTVLPVDVEAIAVNGHAHYLAKRMEMTATLPNGEKRWLLKMSEWHFAWQEDYAFKEPVKLPAGTKIDALISWDNSDANPHQFAHPPKAVKWGPTSQDEMGTITLTVMLNTPAEKKTIHTELKRTLTGQLIERVFENDLSGLGAVRSQIAGDVKMPDEKRMNNLRALALALDVDGNGALDNSELKPGIDALLPFMKGFGEIGLD